MSVDAWSLGARDGDRWLWRRDDVARALVTYTKDGAVESTLPYTAEENRQADRRATQEALRARLRAARGVLGTPAGLTLPERLARVEAVLSALVEEYTNG